MESSILSHLISTLRLSLPELQSRGLYHSAKWSSEIVLGTNSITATSYSNAQNVVASCSIPPTEVDIITFAQSLLCLSEYQRCAHLFQSNNVLQSNLSSISLFIAWYSKYLAGEKIREQSNAENKNSTTNCLLYSTESDENKMTDSNESVNPYVYEIFHEMITYYHQQQCDGFMYYIFAIVVRDLRNKNYNVFIPDKHVLVALPSTEDLFAQSLLAYPWNW
jgi:hypothetical protein